EESEHEESAFKNQHLGQEIPVLAEKLRQKGHEKGDALRIERSHQPGMNHDPHRMHLVMPRAGLKRSASAKQFYAEPDQIGGACPFDCGENICGCREKRTHAKHG